MSRPRSRAGARRVLVAAMLALGAWALLVGAASKPNRAEGDSVPRRRVYSIKDSPGYVPVVDPESAAVAIGRRTNAPVVSKRFRGGARSLDALGRAVCRGLHRGERDSLMVLCVQVDEFRDIMWREFPQSRPATGLEWEDGWRVLLVRLLSGCSRAIGEYGGRSYEFQSFEAESTKTFKNFRLHNGMVLVARDDSGRIQRMRWVRSVAERKGVFKIYSTED
jgi:hypothetical protein